MLIITISSDPVYFQLDCLLKKKKIIFHWPYYIQESLGMSGSPTAVLY